jgi:hypothetical protein
VSAIAATRRARLRAHVAYTLLVVILVAAGCFALWYRATYNVFPGQGASSRVHWCERDYQNDGSPAQSWQQISATTRFPIRAVGAYPPLGLSRQELFAAIYPGAHPASCATVVYLRVAPGRYRPYALLGGP